MRLNNLFFTEKCQNLMVCFSSLPFSFMEWYQSNTLVMNLHFELSLYWFFLHDRHRTRLHIGQLVKDTSARLKQASETDHYAGVSVCLLLVLYCVLKLLLFQIPFWFSNHSRSHWNHINSTPWITNISQLVGHVIQP